MSYILDNVAPSDLPDLVRYCDHPAMLDNPLNMTMFPNASPETKEGEITWHVSGFRETFESNPEAYFRKVCTDDGAPVGFALWTLDQPALHIRFDKKESKADAVRIPGSLDIFAWREISRRMTSEKRRKLKDLTNV